MTDTQIVALIGLVIGMAVCVTGMAFDAIFAITIGALIAIVAVFVGMADESAQWTQFKADHDCKVVGKMAGNIINTIGPNGQVGIGYNPDKTGWLCDDGVTYWR